MQLLSPIERYLKANQNEQLQQNYFFEELARRSMRHGFIIRHFCTRRRTRDLLYEQLSQHQAFYFKIWQVRRDSNPQHSVLETDALPIELLTYKAS